MNDEPGFFECFVGKTFHLTVDHLRNLKKWREEHDKTCSFIRQPRPATGERFTYCFLPTGIGTAQWAECGCGEKCDLTDDDW